MKIDVLGVRIDALKKNEVLMQIKLLLTARKPIFIVTPYSEMIVAAQRDAEFRDVLNSADIATPDGVGILWAANFLRKTQNPKHETQSYKIRVITELFKSLLAIIFYPKYIHDPIPEKISGSEFVWDLAEMAEQNNFTVFLLGGFGETPALAAAALKKKYPNLRIAGTYTGSPKEEGIVERINASNADFLLVALGTKTQEKWIARNLPKLQVKLAIGLGGTFDYLAKQRPYRPKFWARRGLEWLWRLVTQPWRIGRIFRGILGLIWYAFKAKLNNT